MAIAVEAKPAVTEAARQMGTTTHHDQRSPIMVKANIPVPSAMEPWAKLMTRDDL